MSRAVEQIERFERSVMWRKRLLSLQDGLAMALVITGLIAAALVVVVRLRPVAVQLWTVISGVMILSFAAALTRWFFTRASERDAAFLVDETLKLDDRVATSRLIIERGGPRCALEEALIEDTAARIAAQRASSVVPFRAHRWYALSLVSAIGLLAALMIPARSLPVSETFAAERADIESAGEHLEQTASEIEQAAPLGTETSTLAKEQAEVGRGFRRATATRAEALRRLSALEERILKRHDDLASTRAEEIVSLADQRLGSAISALSTKRPTKTTDSQLGLVGDEPPGESKMAASKEPRVTTAGDARKSLESSQQNTGKTKATGSRTKASTKGEQPSADVAADRRAEPQKRQQEPVPGKGNRNADSVDADSNRAGEKIAKEAGAERAAATDPKPSDQKSSDMKVAGQETGDQKAGESKANESKAEQPPAELPAGSLDALKAVPDSLAEQSAKALPKLSTELLKKAAELRANQLSPTDIERLRKAAELLSRDLAKIEQSKELQKALQEMARQIRPDQIEQVARELGNQEQLKQELRAAARLLSENKQAKEMVAGVAGQFTRTQEKRQQDNSHQGAGKSEIRDQGPRVGDLISRNNKGNANAASEKSGTAADRQLAEQGRNSSLKGKLQGSGGEYLYLQSKAGVGAARAAYSSAYPQYRREAERSVQRSQVPPGLRSVVRKYFDAINPESKK